MVDDTARKGGGLHRYDTDAQEFQSRGCLGAKAGQYLGIIEWLGEFNLDDFIAANDAEWQGEGEDHARTGMKAGSGFERKGGATKHSLQAPHEVVVREQPERAGFGEAESELVTKHRCEFRISDCRLMMRD
jgi:hypothetical protein